MKNEMLLTARVGLRNAVGHLSLRDGVSESLALPRRSLEVSTTVGRDSAGVEVFTGWQVQHSTTRGPGKGGIRCHPDVGTDEKVTAWVTDAYSVSAGHSVPAVVTGKPVSIGSSRLTSRGSYQVARGKGVVCG